jgi:hypothetical protein
VVPCRLLVVLGHGRHDPLAVVAADGEHDGNEYSPGDEPPSPG